MKLPEGLLLLLARPAAKHPHHQSADLANLWGLTVRQGVAMAQQRNVLTLECPKCIVLTVRQGVAMAQQGNVLTLESPKCIGKFQLQ